ncbi:MAG: hypothetical protein K1Y36_19395 [Blastocatellia bacterium]|nr:hypothetical protein [Blastocatellia bacterium]
MAAAETPKLPLEQHWLCPPAADSDQPTYTHYRPALLVECQLKFHHLRAQFKHTAERRYTAWYPKGYALPNWDNPAIDLNSSLHLAFGPTLNLSHLTNDYQFTKPFFDECREELLSRLVRAEKLTIYHNTNFNKFSEVDETRDAFIARLAETASESIEDDLNKLVRRVNLKLSQVRETQERRGQQLDIPETYLNSILLERKHELFASQSRLEALFSSSERLLVTSSDGIPSLQIEDPEYHELQETLQRIEDETKRELNDLCTQCIQRASECDAFHIGLQPNQITILRQGVLWVPIQT